MSRVVDLGRRWFGPKLLEPSWHSMGLAVDRIAGHLMCVIQNQDKDKHNKKVVH